MLYGCATWTMRSQDFSSLRTAHHKLLLRIIGFRRKDRIGYKPLSYREVLERTGSERIETTIRKRQLGFLYDKATQGCQSSCLGGWRCKDPSEEVDRRRRGWTAYRKISRPSARSRAGQRTEVGRIRSCCQGWTGLDDCCEEHGQVAPGGPEALDSAWRRADLRQSNVQLQR